MPKSVGQGEKQTTNKFGNHTVKAGWLQQLLATVGIGKTTVFRYLRTSTFPERQGRRDCGRSRILDPYKDYVLQRWNDGCHDALQLFGEIKAQGYSGSYDTVARYTRRFRTAQGTQPRKRRRSIKQHPLVSEPQKLSLTPPKSCTSGVTGTSKAGSGR